MATTRTDTERNQFSTPVMILISGIAAIVVIGLLIMITERDSTPTAGAVTTGGDVMVETDADADIVPVAEEVEVETVIETGDAATEDDMSTDATTDIYVPDDNIAEEVRDASEDEGDAIPAADSEQDGEDTSGGTETFTVPLTPSEDSTSEETPVTE